MTEIRKVRDENADLFSRIKRLPKKARSTKIVALDESPLPALITYFRQGKLDKFFRAQSDQPDAQELDFFQTAKILKPADTAEKRQNIPADFYALLEKSKHAFESATTTAHDDAPSGRGGGQNDAYILKRLKAKEISRYHGYTDEDELFIQRVKQLLTDGALPRPTTKKAAEALKRESDPLKVLGILRRDISTLFLQPTRAQESAYMFNPREVILSSYLVTST